MINQISSDTDQCATPRIKVGNPYRMTAPPITPWASHLSASKCYLRGFTVFIWPMFLSLGMVLQGLLGGVVTARSGTFVTIIKLVFGYGVCFECRPWCEFVFALPADIFVLQQTYELRRRSYSKSSHTFSRIWALKASSFPKELFLQCLQLAILSSQSD
jgi:hypothetical protein